MGVLSAFFSLLRALFARRLGLVPENLALRQQLLVRQRTCKRPRLRRPDRIFWVWLSRLWKSWRSALVVVKPDTVIRWHRMGFRL
jgi:putative transposase